MQILIVHNTLNDSRSISGGLRHFLYMANEWIAAGHQTDFLVAKAGFPQIGKLAPKSRLISSDNIFNATNYLKQTWRYFPAYAHRMMTPHFMRLPQQYDVIFASAQFIVEVYPAMVFARRSKAKFVTKVHHVLGTQAKRAGFFDRLYLWSEKKTAKWISDYADLVLCNNKLVEADYKQLEDALGIRHAPTALSGCGVDMALIKDSSESEKEFDAMHLGRMHEQKGVFHLAPLWKEVLKNKPNAKLLVVGEGPHRPRTEEMFREAGIRESARFTGAVTEEEKFKLMAKSRVGLSVSFEEGWGMSINEFLAAALPVVAYSLPVFDLVFPGQLFGVQLGDYTSAAKQVIELLEKPELRKEAGRRGREFIKRYDFPAVARGELEHLQNLFR